jgi:subtilisin family serine protease
MATRKKSPSKRPATEKTKAKGKPGKTARAGKFPARLFAIASPRSVGGVSLFAPGVLPDASNVANFMSQPEDVQRAAELLRDAGFEVLQANDLMINIAGSKETYERAFGTRLVSSERDTIKAGGRRDKATFFDAAESAVPGFISTAGTRFAEVIEGVALEEPRYLMTPAPFAPTKGYWHLDVPAGVSLGCNADRAHRNGVTGQGIRVAMVDSGWYRHPHFEQRGYRAAAVTLGPGTANPLADENGHGTGESANLFAVAPDVELLPVKAMLAGQREDVLVNATAAFNAAVALTPDIITNSWGFSIRNGPLSASEQALAASIAAAVAAGIVVVFSAGNGHFGFPGQHPDVISAGGVFMRQDGSMRASDYASGFMSNIYPNRRVPDLSGLVGMSPAQYIMLPVAEGAQLDRVLAGGTHPNGDETTATDGWAAFSGTSAAAPQIAGAAALVKQACPRLTPAEVRDILMRTARDVTTGTNAHGNTAVVGPDTATGDGLVDAYRAVLLAKLRCQVAPIAPLLPLRPLIPLLPLRPLLPLTPVHPLLPLHPVLPIRPIRPIQPLVPLRPLIPVRPLRPLVPLQPLLPPPPSPEHTASGAQGTALTPQEVRDLESMILESPRDPMS